MNEDEKRRTIRLNIEAAIAARDVALSRALETLDEPERPSPKPEPDPRLAAFLSALDELTRTHGIKIGGCGCCGSPFLSDEKGRTIGDDLDWDGTNYRASS